MMEKIKNFLSGTIAVMMALDFTPAEVAVIDGGAVVAVIKNKKDEVVETFVNMKLPEWSALDAAQCACEAERSRTIAESEANKARVIILDRENSKVMAIIQHLREDSILTCIKGETKTQKYAVKHCCRSHDWS